MLELSNTKFQRCEIVAKVFPEITLKGSGVGLTLYAVELEYSPGFSVVIDDGESTISLGVVKTYDESTEVIQVVMQGFAALGYDLDSVN